MAFGVQGFRVKFSDFGFWSVLVYQGSLQDLLAQGSFFAGWGCTPLQFSNDLDNPNYLVGPEP